ncbi:MAG: PPOX class F420-dependent oxidoreductase [Chloroflexi bacterium]|nr:MAG: PPOX class F420-dependent oxidoreductase [Chloroflexota bacterium]
MPKRYSREEWERFLRGRRVAVLGTIGKNGAPALTPIWFLYREGRLLMRTSKESVKARNINRDSRVTVCVQDERPPYASVTVYGRASIEAARPGLGLEIARHYLGAVGGQAYMKVAAEAIEQEGGEVTIAVTPEKVLTQDFSPETPLYGRAWMTLKRILPPGL